MVILHHWQVNLAADHDVTPTLCLCLMGFNPFLLCAMPAPPADVPVSKLSLGGTFLHWPGSAALRSGGPLPSDNFNWSRQSTDCSLF